MVEITFRAVIEILGKPKEHIEKTIRGYVENLKQNKRYSVLSEEFSETRKHEDDELWMSFAELEVKTEKIEDLTAFCFDYMPSLIEIITPENMQHTASDFSEFLNDLQAKLHSVDMVAKEVKMENDIFKQGMGGLLKNYVNVLLSKGGLTGKQLAGLTGMVQDYLEDFLDQLIDEGKIDLKGETYFLVKNDQ